MEDTKKARPSKSTKIRDLINLQILKQYVPGLHGCKSHSLVYIIVSSLVFFMGFPSVQTSGSLIPVPSLRLFSFFPFILSNFNAMVFVLLYFISLCFDVIF